jgi:hypothetical protein
MTGHAMATALLSASDVSRYHADGFLVVRGLFGADRIAALDVEAERLKQRTDLIIPTTFAAGGRPSLKPGSAASTATIR